MAQIVRPIKTVVCSPAVLAAVTDESLVRLCQCPTVTIQTYNSQSWRFEELTLDAVQMELCRRYEPLIIKYAHLSTHQSVQEDIESFLWMIFIEAIHSYDTTGEVPFPGYVKSMIHYGHLRFFKHSCRQWRHEVSLPMMSDDDDIDTPAMDQFPDTFTLETEVMDKAQEQSLRQRLWQAFRQLTPDQQQLLQRIYQDKQSYHALSNHSSWQAVQRRHKRALRQLQQYMMCVNS